jgi:hypothetical protein
MARTELPTNALFDELIAKGISTPLKSAGFRKSGSNYHRRLSQTVQAVNVQISRGSSTSEKTFYINAGVAFDAICDLAGKPIVERPKEYECDDRGTRGRLGELINGMPDSWIVRAGEDIVDMMRSVKDGVERLCLELDQIDSVAAYRSHRWFDRFRPTGINAQILYLLGDSDGAWREVQDLAVCFADRVNANGTDWWIEELHLSSLNR